MQKKLIKNFIKLYFLNGINESSIWKYSKNKIKVELISECRSLITSVKTKNNIVDLKDNIAIFDNGQFLNLLNLCEDNDENFKLKIDNKKIQFEGNSNIKPIFMLADADVINNDGNEFVKKCELMDDWSASFELSKENINLLCKSKVALSTAKTLYINTNQIIIGNNTQSENRVEFNIDTQVNNEFDEKMFNLEFFITIISLLEDNVKCYIHDKGMIKLLKETDDFICNYYLIALQN